MCLSPPTLFNQSSQCDTTNKTMTCNMLLCPLHTSPHSECKKCSQKTTSKFNLNWTKGRHKISK